MRWMSLGCAALWLTLMSSPVAAAQPGAPARRVEIISLTARPVPARDGDVEPASEFVEQSDAPLSSPPFRTHDISRRLVAFEMANSFSYFAADATSPEKNAEGPFARPDVATLPPPARSFEPPAFRSIAIPAWMNGGRGLSTGANRFLPECTENFHRPTGFLDRGAENRRSDHYATMRSVACEYGIPVGLFDALIIKESLYRANAYSPKRAFGLTQLMPDTANFLGVDRFDVEQNLRGGARYLRRQLDTFGHVHLALAAYNAGPGRVRHGLIPQIAETQAYVDGVLQNWRRLTPDTGIQVSTASMAPRRPPIRTVRTVVMASY